MNRTHLAGLLAFVVMLFAAPAAASAHVITPEVDCVQPTRLGYVAHFTYTASSLSGGNEFIPAGDNLSGPEGNELSIAGVGTQGNGQQAWTELFLNGTHNTGFQVFFKTGSSVTWTVRIDFTNRSATANADSPKCPGGTNGEDGEDGEDGQDGLPGNTIDLTVIEPGDEYCPNGGTLITTYEAVPNEQDPEWETAEVAEIYLPYTWQVKETARVCNGANGSDGANGRNGSNGADGEDLTACSTNRVAKLRIKAAKGDKVRRLRVDFEGHKLTIKNGLLRKVGKRTWKATVDMRGYPSGVYGVRVRARVNGAMFRHVHLYRSCPSKFTTGSLNAKRFVVLGSDAQNMAGSNR